MNQPEIVEMLVKRDARIAELQEEVNQLKELLKEALDWIEKIPDTRSVETEMKIKTALK